MAHKTNFLLFTLDLRAGPFVEMKVHNPKTIGKLP